jgi:YidC/Oxa1 family membrane protein insertase
LPWWATIALTTVIIRVALFPLVIKSQRAVAKIQNIKPVLTPLQEEMQRFQKEGNTIAYQKTAMKMKKVYGDAGVSPFAPLLGIAQVTFFLYIVTHLVNSPI